MGKIKISNTANAPMDTVFPSARDVHDLVEFLPNIKRINVINKSEDGNYSRLEWVLKLNLPVPKGKLSWTEDIYWNEEDKKCRFCLSPDSKGYISRMEGVLILKPVSEGTQMIMEVDFGVDHPLVSSRVEKLFDALMRKNNEALLLGIKSKSESCGCHRSHHRR